MALCRTGTLGALIWTMLLAGAPAEIGHLDYLTRSPKIAPFDYYDPRVTTPRPEIVVPRQSNISGANIDDPEQRAQYNADTRKTIVELQPFRRIETAAIQTSEARRGRAMLINLNPNSNAWFLLTLDWGPNGRVTYHLENPDPVGQGIHLVEGQTGVVITTATQSGLCDLWTGKPTVLERAISTGLPYAPICDAHLQLRNRVAGNFTDLERLTDFLRQNVWKGDDIVGFVRENFYQDAFRETGGTAPTDEQPAARAQSDQPATATLRPAAANQSVSPPNFEIDVEAPSRQLALGRWYAVRNLSGVYASLMRPQAVSDEIVLADKGAVNALDAIEGSALVALTAFDLSQFEMKYALGTDHPRLGWSVRIARSDGLPGPDGIDSTAPLVTNGMVNPALLTRVVATFAGGFKREQGAFQYGDLAHMHQGSHYGFIEQGIIFSKLQPGLSTLYALDDGSVHMETWTENNDKLLGLIQFARQNGVPLIELGAKGTPIPGRLVTSWGAGNWSGSADAQLRTLRAGACLLQSGGKEYLVQAVFSTATPSAMALVFHAYGCRYAMLLDMNALEYSYLALYVRQGDKLIVEHPFYGMTDVDRTTSGQLVPRFVGFPDNRDFFYLVRRKSVSGVSAPLPDPLDFV